MKWNEMQWNYDQIQPIFWPEMLTFVVITMKQQQPMTKHQPII